MIPVSAAWETAGKQQFRYQMYLKAVLDLSPPGLREGITVQSAATYPRSNIHNLVDTNRDIPTKYATLEPNRWILDGTFDILKANTVIDDWWSKVYPTIDDPIIIHFEFDKVYTIPGIVIWVDKDYDSWPSNITLKGYDLDGTEIYSKNFSNIAKETESFEADMTQISSFDLYINEWNAPEWRARFIEISFGMIVDFESENNGRINSATVNRSVSVIGSELPRYDATVNFRNLDKYFDPTLSSGISKYMAAQQYFTLQWGFVVSYGQLEWMPKLPMFIQNFSIPENSRDVSINLTNRLTLLSDDYKKGVYSTNAITLYDMALTILQNSNVINELEGQIPWELPVVLKNFTTNAPVPTLPTNQILQLIAQASCTVLDIDGLTGFITFKSPQPTAGNSCGITEKQALSDPGIEVNDQLQSITFNVYSYTISNTTSEIGTSEFILSEATEVWIKYRSNHAINVSATVQNGTLQSATYYLGYALLKLNPTTPGTTVNVVLNGQTIESTTTLVETYNNVKVSNGINVVIENPLITTTAYLSQQSAFIRRYYEKRTKYKMPYLGYLQLEPMDRIALKTIYGQDDVDVLSNNLKFNGGISGNIEVI